MSHGASSEGAVAEPNLTPLLDVVLQLLMFFMMCVNFVSEQNNEDVKLPDSASAQPMDKAETDVLFINLKPYAPAEFRDRLPPDVLARVSDKFGGGDPFILVVGKEPMKPIDLKFWLKQRFEDEKKNSKDNTVNTAVIIRADQNTDYAQVFDLLQMCKVQGYRKLKLRAITKAGGGS